MDAFMKFDGIEGGSQSKDHQGAVEVLSWDWGISATTSAPTGGGAGAGKARAHEFQIIHRYDLASPLLAASAATGKHLKEAILTVARPGADEDFVTVTMKDLVVTEVLVSGDEDELNEQVSLQPSWISIDYAEPGHGGGPTGRTSRFAWDVRSNKMG
ncbi:type VI secretion system tube protein Hcp [Terrabacter sp. NPDC000476]|jgi:type VI secretion system secreted protein Hcp|uniref:Hcp family type VI secretion system effector n=1 Tax=Terrabacter sp. NPDC000476 TaxID=3154258 RepID=UPI003333ABD0